MSDSTAPAPAPAAPASVLTAPSPAPVLAAPSPSAPSPAPAAAVAAAAAAGSAAEGGAAATPLVALPLETLAASILKGDLRFEDTRGENYAAALARGLAAAGITHEGRARRPVAAPRDLVRLLGHAEAGDVAVEMLAELISVRCITHGKTYGELRIANMARLPFVDSDCVAALLGDFERRASALAAASLGAEPAASGGTAAVAISKVAAMLCNVELYYDVTLLGPAVRTFGFERYFRALVLASKAIAAADPAFKVRPHLRVWNLFGTIHRRIIYHWDDCMKKDNTSSQVVAGEFERAIAPVATLLAEAFAPLAKCADPLIFKDSWWTSAMVYLMDFSTTAEALCAAGGAAPLLREATDTSSKSLTSLLIAINNGVRFLPAARAFVELKAPQLLAPLVYSSNAAAANWACLNLCILASHPELSATIEATGVLSDVLLVQRSMMDVSGGYDFASADVAVRMALTHKDAAPALRLTGARELLLYTKNAISSAKAGKETLLELLKSGGVIERARELAVDGDAFLYVHAVGVLTALALPLPYFRDARPAGAAREVSVLAWSVEDVCAWVGRQTFRAHRPLFREALVDGGSLSTLSDAELAEMGVSSCSC